MIGKRTAAKAVVRSPFGDILMYSDHFEMYCGMEGRLGMLNDIILDCKTKGIKEGEEDRDGLIFISDSHLQVIAGDLNTFCSGIVPQFK